jgi:serine/threonine protein kinase
MDSEWSPFPFRRGAHRARRSECLADPHRQNVMHRDITPEQMLLRGALAG